MPGAGSAGQETRITKDDANLIREFIAEGVATRHIRKGRAFTLHYCRATHLIRQGYGEAIIRKLLWRNLDTEMVSVYHHLTGSDVERGVAEKAGGGSPGPNVRKHWTPTNAPVLHK